MKELIKVVSTNLWIDEPGTENFVWDSEMMILSGIMTINGEPKGCVHSISVPDHETESMKNHNEYDSWNNKESF